jgi:biopolymer transport protein ExbD
VRIAADAAVAHARVVEIIDAMKRGGVKRFALMIAPK